MRTWTLTCAALAAFGLTAKPAMAAPPIFNWTGFYVGVSGGGGSATSPWREDTTGNIEARLSGSGPILGATAGVNWQNGPWVYGGETDISWAHIWAKTTNADFPNGANSEVNWLGTARARLGYLASPTVLIYATGGLAVGRIHSWYDNGPGLAADNRNDTKVGLTIGGGAAFMVAPGWSVKVEYLYVDYGSFDVGLAVVVPPVTYTAVNYHLNILRIGADFHF
jgi:outer membrane immunogenic protein